MAKSIDRVRDAALAAGLAIEIRRMGESTRTAEDAAAQCGVGVGQIVKSLIFQGERTGELFLFLVPGDRRLDAEKSAALAGETLLRADPRLVRERTGFAIGGVSPIGHTIPISAFADRAFEDHDLVWAAAGAHDAVFSCEPSALLKAANARIADISA